MNLCIFKGNLTRDAELSYTQSNVAIAKFGLAVNERVKRGDTYEDKAHFLDMVIFGRRAEVFAEHHHKGDPALLTCRASFNSWTAKDGTKRSKVEFIVDDFEFIKPREQQGNQQQSRPHQERPPQPQPQTKQRQLEPTYASDGVEINPDDIPF